MLEHNHYGQINKLILQSEMQSSVQDRREQVENRQKPKIKIFKGDDDDFEEKIINANEIDLLDTQYKKNEYNAQKKHHHNIPTMDKFKDLLMGNKL